MKPFDNRSDSGKEKAIRRGRVVPPDAVNMAWTRTPKMTTDKNMVVIDTSRVVEENNIKAAGARKLYYANSLGVLEDEFGNQLVEDQYPIVSDVFSVDEDYSTVPGNEYSDTDILPFVHRSRFFHIDYAGLTLPGDLFSYATSRIKVIDSDGRDYVDDEGNPRYRIKIYNAFTQESTGEQAAYRVHAYVDTNDNEGLYLLYNKVEVDEDGLFKERSSNYREILNPIPYFEYRPEESEVVDPANREKKIYSTQQISLRDQILGTPVGYKDGYRVFVPKKAIGDPRIFQLFRWRVSCTFVQQFKVDPADRKGVRCGVVVTGETPNDKSYTPYLWYNLERSEYNPLGLKFYNPLNEGVDDIASDEAKEQADYWKVNFDTVTNEELRQFDVLVWSPWGVTFDFATYEAKIDYFVYTLGGTLLIDTNNRTLTTGLGVLVTSPTTRAGKPKVATDPGNVNERGWASSKDTHPDRRSVYFSALSSIGGWNFNDGSDEEYRTLSAWNTAGNITTGKNHFIRSIPKGWSVVMRATAQPHQPWAGALKPIIVEAGAGRYPGRITSQLFKKIPQSWPPITEENSARLPGGAGASGTLVYTTYGIAMTCNSLYSHTTYKLVDPNVEDEIYRDDNYWQYITYGQVEGAYKFLYNVALLGVRGRGLNDTDESVYSTSYTFSTDWKSSWVIDGDVLGDEERDLNDFSLLPSDSATPDPVWQRKLSDKNLANLLDSEMTPDMKEKVKGAQRYYVIETTNSKVLVPGDVSGDNFPYAWTEEYSPEFSVPVELGPHVVRAESLKADFEAGQYIHRSYPAKPYSGRVRLDYIESDHLGIVRDVRWTANGTATETVVTGVNIPPSSSTTESEVELTWGQHGSKLILPSGNTWNANEPDPAGLDTWQDWNYYNNSFGTGMLNWPHFGLYHKLDFGSTGDVVTWLQDVLNVLIFFGVFEHPALKIDGYYGSRTKSAVLAFQDSREARYQDGVVEAETFALLGAQILALGSIVDLTRKREGWQRYWFWPRDRMQRKAISDHNYDSVYAKRSWLEGGPSVIWDMFMMVFEDVYSIHGVSFTPYVDGKTPTVMFRSIDVRTQPFTLANYDSRTGNPIWMPHRPRDGQKIYVPFSPRRGDTLIVGVGQDGGSGFGTSRMLGVRDIRAHARVRTTTLTPGINTITKQTRTVDIQDRGLAYLATGIAQTDRAQPKYLGDGKLSNIRWNSIEVDDDQVIASIDTSGLVSLRHLTHETLEEEYFRDGQLLPYDTTNLSAPVAYWMDAGTKRISGQRAASSISKPDGVKLLCDRNGAAIGFPASLPTAIGPHERQRHYAKLTLLTYGLDPSVRMGFYDVSSKEFVVNSKGEPEISFVEYTKRGKQNIYVGVVSTYEEQTKAPLPSADDAPPLPYKWAMPVYGLYRQTGSRIGLEPLPTTLGVDEPWPVAVRTGSFERVVPIRPLSEGALAGWVAAYQGTTLTAHYAVPEAAHSDWSTLHGPPYADVRGETPEILDDNLLRVSQPPILLRELPTDSPSAADPVRAILTLDHRDSVDDEWETVPYSDIADINASTGEIWLTTAMGEVDPLLWRVNYTTTRRAYHLKGSHEFIIDLNPYHKFSQTFSDQPLYIYIQPQFVRDPNGTILYSQVRTETLGYTFDPGLFDPLDPDYDPLAIQLGVVYMSTALDLRDLTIMDTRRRGGGALVEMNTNEVVRLVQEASNYWDLNYGSGLSYQNGGFVVIRLPEELKDTFTEQDIMRAVERNIPIGVGYKLEDLSGKDWS